MAKNIFLIDKQPPSCPPTVRRR